MKGEEIFITICIIIFLLSLVFETGLLIYAYLNADKVTCNFLWCEFTQERTEINQRIVISKTKECYVNGIKINCSE